MSAEFKILHEGDLFRVKIDHDGAMTILYPPVDMEYEIAFEAMGGDKSPASRLMDAWNLDPISIIIYHILPGDFSPTNLYLLAFDWAEHTLWIYKSKFPDKTNIISEARQKSRSAIISGMAPQADLRAKISEMAEGALKLAESQPKPEQPQSMDSLHYWAAWHAISSFLEAVRRSPEKCALKSMIAAASFGSASMEGLLEKYQKAQKMEILWQVRRFVDVAEAISSGQPWPKLGATN